MARTYTDAIGQLRELGTGKLVGSGSNTSNTPLPPGPASVISGSAAGQSARALEQFQRNISRVVDGVRAGLFSSAIEAACRVLVNEAKRKDRPLAWNDITGNLRSSISFQVEGRVKAPVILSRDGSGAVYNTTDYVSGQDRRDGEYGIVYAPPEYAAPLEFKASRSVLLEPLATVQKALAAEMGREARASWELFMGREIVADHSIGQALR